MDRGYRLALKNAATGTLIKGDGLKLETSSETGRKHVLPVMPVLNGGEKYSAVLQADVEALKHMFEQRFVYVFCLDSQGRSQLLWPRGGLGNSQRFPPPPVGNAVSPEEISLNAMFSVGAPYGVDTYVMLTSLTPIPDATVLEFDGVRSGSRGRDDSNPLQRLLESVGNPTRGAVRDSPADWSISDCQCAVWNAEKEGSQLLALSLATAGNIAGESLQPAGDRLSQRRPGGAWRRQACLS